MPFPFSPFEISPYDIFLKKKKIGISVDTRGSKNIWRIFGIMLKRIESLELVVFFSDERNFVSSIGDKNFKKRACIYARICRWISLIN